MFRVLCSNFSFLPDSENVLNGNAMTASSRITAITLVAELLRKVNVSKTFDFAFFQFSGGLNVIWAL